MLIHNRPNLKGSCPFTYVESKVNDIVYLNPWLQSKAIRKSDGQVYLKYFEEPICNSFSSAYIPDIKIGLEYGSDIGEKLNNFRIKRGQKALIGTGEPLFKIMVIMIDDNHFGVFFSISHALADGSTMYHIHGMLHKDVLVESMIVERVQSFPEARIKIDKNQVQNWVRSPGVIGNMLLHYAFGAKLIKAECRYINQDYIDEMKSDYVSSDQSFVSTNDVLTSSLMNIANADLVVIAVNMRGKRECENITSLNAGNYLSGILLQKDDFDDPRNVRNSIKQHFRSKSGHLLGFCGTLFSKIVMITNWTTLYKDVELPGCEQILHLPVFKIINNFGSISLPNVYYIFRPVKDKLAVLIVDRNLDEVLDKFIEHKILHVYM
eukprot:gene14802-19888_t